MCSIDTVKTLYLGHYEEKNSRTVQIDVSSWMTPTAQFSIIFKRYGDTQEYFAENVVVDESGILTWTLTLFDMAVKGNGEATIVRFDGETIKKTGIIRTVVDDSLPTDANPNPPQPVPSWLTEVLEKANAILDAQAEQFAINEQGHLIVTKVDGTTEDLGQVVGSGGVTSVNGKTGNVFLNAFDVSGVRQVTGEFLYNDGEDLPAEFDGKIVQCISNYSNIYKAGYFYEITDAGRLREQKDVQPQPVIPEIEHIQKSGADLDDQQDVVTGGIYQCVSDYITSHSNISNDTQFHKGYFYVFNGFSTQYYYTRIDVQPTSGGAVDSVNGKTGVVVLDALDVSAIPQKTGQWLWEHRNDVDLENKKFQCSAYYSTGHSIFTEFIEGYFYKLKGEVLPEQIDVQPNAVDSVNGKTGPVVLTAPDVGALPDNTPIPTKTSDLQNDSGFITDNDTLAVGSVEVEVNAIKPYDYEQTYTIPQDITSGSTVRVEFANTLREFTLEITTLERVISAGTGYFYLTLDNGNGGGRFWEPAFGQNHASKLCVSFTVGRDGIYRLNGYKYDLTNNSDYSLMTTYNTLARQNIGRLFLENPRPIASIYFTSGGDISELAGSTIKVRGLKW